MPRQRSFSISSFLVQAALVFLPVLLLAGIGFWLLFKDRKTAQREAVEVAEDISRRATQEIATNISTFLDAEIRKWHPGNDATNYSLAGPDRGWNPRTTNNPFLFGVIVEHTVLSPAPLLPVNTEVDATTPAGALYRKAQVAEFQQHDLNLAAQLYDQAAESDTKGRVKCLALYAAGCAYVSLDRRTEAEERPRAVDTVSEDGIPSIIQLAEFKRILIGESSKAQELLPVLLNHIVTQPTQLSMELLRQIQVFAATNTNANIAAEDLSSAEFALKQRALAREFGAALLSVSNAKPIQDATTTTFNQTRYLVLRWQSETNAAITFFGLPLDRVDSFIQQVAAAPQTVRVPKYLRLLAGWPEEIATNLPPLAVSKAQIAVAGPDGFSQSSIPLTVAVALTDAPSYYHAQTLRKTVFYMVIVGCSLLAGIGLAVMRAGMIRLQRVNELKSNFVASVSHEFRAPLASVRLLAENLDRKTISDPAHQQEYFKLIVQECDRLGNLIENLLAFARQERGQNGRLDSRPINPCEVVNHCITILQPIAQRRGVTISLIIQESAPPLSDDLGAYIVEPRATATRSADLSQISGPPWMILADQRALTQVLLNFLDNALKFSPANSQIEIVVGPRELREGAYIAISVRDSGPGIDSREHTRIFEPFYRIGSELTRETAGVGIGLSLVKQIIKDHGGGLYLRSAPGGGSTFTILLPRTVPDSSISSDS